MDTSEIFKSLNADRPPSIAPPTNVIVDDLLVLRAPLEPGGSGGIGGGGPPPSDCKCSLSVTFHDVLLDCGCMYLNPSELTGSGIWEDDGVFNENTFTICRYESIAKYEAGFECGNPVNSTCPRFSSRGPGCYFENNEYGEPKWAKNSTNFSNDFEDCSGEFNNDSARIELVQLDDIWHLLVWSFNGGILLFYGTIDDLSSPIPNLLTCSPPSDPYCYDDDGCFGIPEEITNCAAWLSPHMAVSHGGYASIEVVAAPCGMCCTVFPESDPECYEMSETQCAQYGSDYGADTTWTPGECPLDGTCTP